MDFMEESYETIMVRSKYHHSISNTRRPLSFTIVCGLEIRKERVPSRGDSLFDLLTLSTAAEFIVTCEN